ncbi:MAG: Crp/Fnr family transcriptional regulator [Crocinitomicaceae bacterium]|nr:Crp/Fnr family transcriptional regulator [Crocinitomicaceae bacterium]
MPSTKQIKKGTLLQEVGQCPQVAYVVHSGLLRSFFVDERGKEHTFMFAPEGWIIADLEASGFGNATRLAIEALEDSEVELQPMLDRVLQAQDVQSQFKLMHRRAGALQRRVLMMMSTSALERYEFFLETYPQLSGRISQKLIASYLGITPQALSKLRAERVGK